MLSAFSRGDVDDPGVHASFRLFARVFTLPILADLAVRDPAGSEKTVLFALSLCVFVWPGSVVLVTAMAAAFFAAWTPELDGEHGYVAAVVSGTVLVAVTSLLVVERRWPTPVDLYAVLRTPAQVVAFTLFFAGFAKINRDFLDHRVSCGGVYYLWLREWPGLSFLPTGAGAKTAAILGSMLFEMMGPLFLVSPRTRKLGLVFTWAVLFGICALPRAVYFTFAGLFWACSLFFVEPRWLVGRKGERALPSGRAARWRAALSFPLAAAGLFVLARATAEVTDVLSWQLYAWRVIGLVVILQVAAKVGAAWWREARDGGPAATSTEGGLLLAQTGWRRHGLRAAVLVLPVIMIFNEVSVYIGLDHRPALRMASNARLVPVGGNHLIFQPVPTLPFTADVEIVASDVAGLPPGHHLAKPLFDELTARARAGSRVVFRVSGGDPQELVIDGEEKRSGSLLARILPLKPYVPRTEANYCPKAEPGLSRRETLQRMKRRLGR